ncbi:pre-mRNA-splicing factor ATP-dependent RNA helicase DEAH7 [Tanacetum coccineum]
MKTRRTCYDSEGEKRALKKRVEKCSSVCSSAVIPKFRVGSGWVWTAYSGIVVKGGGMVHGLVLKFGFGLDLFVLSSLVSMYAKFGDVGSARRVFDWMGEKERDVVTWNALFALFGWLVLKLWGFGYGLCERLFDWMGGRRGDVVTGMRCLDGYALLDGVCFAIGYGWICLSLSSLVSICTRNLGMWGVRGWFLIGMEGKERLIAETCKSFDGQGLDVLASAKRVEGSFKVPRPKVSSMMASMDEDVEKTSLADQDDVESGLSSSGQNKSRKYRDSSGSKTFDSDSQTTEERSARYASTSHAERDTPSRSSRSGDHRCSRRDSPEYDRRVSPEYDRRQGYAASPWDNVAPSPVPIRASGSVRSASSRTGGRSHRPLDAENSQLTEDEEANNEKFINPEITESMRLEMEYDADRACELEARVKERSKSKEDQLFTSSAQSMEVVDLQDSSDDNESMRGKGRKRVAAPKGRGRASVTTSAAVRSLAADEENLNSDSEDEPVQYGINDLQDSSDDNESMRGKGRKRAAAPRGRGRGTTASKRGKKTDSSSSSINRMMMTNDDDDDDDDDDVPKKMNKSQPRLRLCDYVMEKDEKNVKFAVVS